MPVTTPLPYSWPQLRRLCRAISQTVTELSLAEHRVHLVGCLPFKSEPGWRVNTHAHSFYEASIIVAGGGLYGAQRLMPGHVLFHAPMTPHTWGTPDTPCLRLVFSFHVTPGIPAIPPPAWPCWPEMVDDAAALLASVHRAAPGWPDLAAARVALITSRLFTLGKLAAPTIHVDPPPSLVATIDQFLLDNYQRPLTLADIAAHAGVSVPHLTRLFRRMSGGTIIERLITLRMERAAVLLTGTELPLSEIAQKVGIPDLPYFCRRFRNHYHTTPQQYRYAGVDRQGE